MEHGSKEGEPIVKENNEYTQHDSSKRGHSGGRILHDEGRRQGPKLWEGRRKDTEMS